MEERINRSIGIEWMRIGESEDRFCSAIVVTCREND